MKVLNIVDGQSVLFGHLNNIDKEKGVLRIVNRGTIATNLTRNKKDVD